MNRELVDLCEEMIEALSELSTATDLDTSKARAEHARDWYRSRLREIDGGPVRTGRRGAFDLDRERAVVGGLS